MMKTLRTVVHISPELRAAIDQARGDAPMSGYVEAALWRLAGIREAAAAAGVKNPRRPIDKRGKYERRPAQ